MGDSVLFGDLQNLSNQERAREVQRRFRTKIVIMGSFLMFIFSVTLLANRVGINSKEMTLYKEDELCAIDISSWYVTYTTLVACKLLLTIARYYFFKKHRMEHLMLYFSDIIGMNLLMTGIFIQANTMYFSQKNLCWYTND